MFLYQKKILQKKLYKSLLYDIVADISWKQSAGSLLIAIGGAQAGEKIANKDPQTLL